MSNVVDATAPAANVFDRMPRQTKTKHPAFSPEKIQEQDLPTPLKQVAPAAPQRVHDKDGRDVDLSSTGRCFAMFVAAAFLVSDIIDLRKFQES